MVISNTQILSATPGMTKNNKVKWDISLANGRTYTAWDLEKYQKALQHMNMPVDVEIVQKGQWENFGDVRPAGGQANVVQGQGLPPNTYVPTQLPVPPLPTGTPDAKDERIGKMNASSTAFAFVAELFGAGYDEEQIRGLALLADELAEVIYAKNHNLPVPAFYRSATPTTVQQQVNEVVGSEAVTSGNTNVQVQW